MTLAVICYLWRNGVGKDPVGPEQVNVLRRMVARHLTVPHAFWCVTDDATGLDPEVRVAPIERRLIPYRGCLPKLMTFRRDAREMFGADRLLVLDLDVVITRSIDAIAGRAEDIVIWRDALHERPNFQYNSSLINVRAGAFPEVYESFDLITSPERMSAAGWLPGDQSWIAFTLGHDLPVYTQADGVKSYKFDAGHADAAMVFFHGRGVKPWQAQTQTRNGWVREHYR